MPTDWENNVIVKRPNTKTRFCSVPIQDTTTCHKVSFLTYLTINNCIMSSSSESIIQVVTPFLYVSQKEEVVAYHGLLCKFTTFYPFKHCFNIFCI